MNNESKLNGNNINFKALKACERRTQQTNRLLENTVAFVLRICTNFPNMLYYYLYCCSNTGVNNNNNNNNI